MTMEAEEKCTPRRAMMLLIFLVGKVSCYWKSKFFFFDYLMCLIL